MADFISALKCVRFVESVGDEDGHTATVRAYLTYSGSAPSSADLTACAAAFDSAYGTYMTPDMHSTWTTAGCIATDLSTITSAQGEASTPTAGALTGGRLPASACVVVSQLTGRRIRGGRSRVYIPAGDSSKLLTDGEWTSAFAADVSSQWQITVELAAAAIWGGGGVFTQVLASFYSGFTNMAYGVPTKYRRVPTARGTAEFYDVINYVGKTPLGSQRRRLRS